jgi:hypothetical protein
MGGKLINLHAVLGKCERAIDMAKPIGQVEQGDGCVREFQFSAELRMHRVAGNIHRESGWTVRHKVGIKHLQQLQIKSSARTQIQRLISGKLHRSSGHQIGVSA